MIEKKGGEREKRLREEQEQFRKELLGLVKPIFPVGEFKKEEEENARSSKTK